MLNASERLSSELWARVFMHLSPNQWRPGVRPRRLAKEDVEQYPHLHRLQLVCRKFAAVFREHHHLFGAMYLRENLTVQALPGLLAWLQRHNSDISCLQSICSKGPCTDVALTSLVGTRQLRTVDLMAPTDSAIQILSMCSALVSCTLRRPGPSLQLDSLQRLQELAYLRPGRRHILRTLDTTTDCIGSVQCSGSCQCCCDRRLWAAIPFSESKCDQGTNDWHPHILWADGARMCSVSCADINRYLQAEY